jgi:hypothetical protein
MLMILVCISLIISYSFVFLSLTLSSTAGMLSKTHWACKHLSFAHQGDEKGANIHNNLCGGHHFWKTTAYKILKVGYYWPTLFIDVCKKTRACIKCQRFSRKK